MAKLESDIQVRVLDYEKQMIQSKSSIISAEANGQSWLQRNWRPITMLTFLGLVVCDSFGLLTFRLAPEAWTLLQIGMEWLCYWAFVRKGFAIHSKKVVFLNNLPFKLRFIQYFDTIKNKFASLRRFFYYGSTKSNVVGAGNVGASAAQRIVEKQLADVVLVDIVEGLAEGKALDMMQSAATEGFDTSIIGSNYEQTDNSDVIIVTAGIARKPGMSRDDLIETNAKIVSSVVEETVKRSPNAIYVIVSNPLDAMTFLAWKKSGLPAERVVGMAGVLDSSRYACFYC